MFAAARTSVRRYPRARILRVSRRGAGTGEPEGQRQSSKGRGRKRPNTSRSRCCRLATTNAAKVGPRALSPASANMTGCGGKPCTRFQTRGRLSIHVVPQASATKVTSPSDGVLIPRCARRCPRGEPSRMKSGSSFALISCGPTISRDRPARYREACLGCSQAGGREIARRAGGLLARARMSSSNAVDAFVVATALEFDVAVIASGDPTDLARLAAPFRQISLMHL